MCQKSEVLPTKSRQLVRQEGRQQAKKQNKTFTSSDSKKAIAKNKRCNSQKEKINSIVTDLKGGSVGNIINGVVNGIREMFK